MTILQNMLIDRSWEETGRAEEIRKLIPDGINQLLPNEEADLRLFLNQLPGTYEVQKKGTTWEQWLEREGYKPNPYQEYDEMTDHIKAQYVKATSQQDEILAKSRDPAMYGITNTKAILEIDSKPVVWAEQLSEHTVEYRVENIPHAQAMRIIKDILPKVITIYLEKSKDYPDWPSLGMRGEFVEIWRKAHKLKRGIWDGQPMASEPVEEILMDMVAHCLLGLDASPNAVV